MELSQERCTHMYVCLCVGMYYIYYILYVYIVEAQGILKKKNAAQNYIQSKKSLF